MQRINECEKPDHTDFRAIDFEAGNRNRMIPPHQRDSGNSLFSTPKIKRSKNKVGRKHEHLEL